MAKQKKFRDNRPTPEEVYLSKGPNWTEVTAVGIWDGSKLIVTMPNGREVYMSLAVTGDDTLEEGKYYYVKGSLTYEITENSRIPMVIVRQCFVSTYIRNTWL